MYNYFSVAATRKVHLRWTYVQIDCHTTKIRQPMAPLSAASGTQWITITTKILSVTLSSLSPIRALQKCNIPTASRQNRSLCAWSIYKSLSANLQTLLGALFWGYQLYFLNESGSLLHLFAPLEEQIPHNHQLTLGLSLLKAAAGKLSGSCMLLLELNWKEERRNAVSSVSQWRSTLKKRRCHWQRSGLSSTSSMQC